MNIRLSCLCRAEIQDDETTGNMPNKAWLMPNQDIAKSENDTLARIRDTIDEAKSKSIADWEALINTVEVVIREHSLEYVVPIYQCTNCGRLLIPTTVNNEIEILFFTPENQRPPYKALYSRRDDT